MCGLYTYRDILFILDWNNFQHWTEVYKDNHFLYLFILNYYYKVKGMNFNYIVFFLFSFTLMCPHKIDPFRFKTSKCHIIKSRNKLISHRSPTTNYIYGSF